MARKKQHSAAKQNKTNGSIMHGIMKHHGTNPEMQAIASSMGYTTTGASAVKGSKKRTSKAAEEYESDGGFVANEDDDDAPKPKKAKTGNAKSAAKGKNESSFEVSATTPGSTGDPS